MAEKFSALEAVLEGLMRRYKTRVPDVAAITQKMISAGIIRSADEIENDHIAFRTMGVPNLGIASLEKIFLHYGYTKQDKFDFPVKKLTAYWYSTPAKHFPRIFISELRVEELSDDAQTIIKSYTDEVKNDPVSGIDPDDAAAVDAFLHTSLWRRPTWQDYQRLSEESEYAAWVIYNRYYLNHFTISVHNLPEGYGAIHQFNNFLEKNGFKLNDSGGKAKISGDGLLVQSSTVAEMVEAEFDDGTGGTVKKMIAGSYVEFAERKVLPEFRDVPGNAATRKQRREGFEAGNADKIFESTYSAQTQKN